MRGTRSNRRIVRLRSAFSYLLSQEISKTNPGPFVNRRLIMLFEEVFGDHSWLFDDPFFFGTNYQADELRHAPG
jgi:hypothetical protein